MKTVNLSESEIESLRIRLLNNHIKNPNTGCWNWLGTVSKLGYGYLSVNNKNSTVHRISHKVFNGPIPDGMFVLHSCDNRL
jgi:hypothetical protein